MKIISRILFVFMLMINCHQSTAGFEEDDIQKSLPFMRLPHPQGITLQDLPPNTIVHHLPKDREDCIKAEKAYWQGRDFYLEKKYNDSIPYFLQAEQYYEPDCLRYLYNLIEYADFYVKKANVSQENIDLIKSRLPDKIELKTLEQIYRERFLKVPYFSGVTPGQVYEKNKKQVSSISRPGISYQDVAVSQKSFSTRMVEGLYHFFPSSFSAKGKED